MDAVQNQVSLLDGWEISIPWWQYLLYCAIGSLVVRGILAIFKTFQVVQQEPQNKNEDGKRFNDFIGESGFCRWAIFVTDLGGPRQIKDYWLGFLIGFAELAAFPVFFFTGNLAAIGGWIAIKTAGQWEGWSKSLPNFNRFLLANILVLSISFFGMCGFIKRTEIPPIRPDHSLIQRVQKWDGSLAVRIPSVFARETDLTSGSVVRLYLCNGKIVVDPKRAHLTSAPLVQANAKEGPKKTGK